MFISQVKGHSDIYLAGRNYNERSLLPGAWWSNETTARYMAMANCTEPLLHLFNRTYSTVSIVTQTSPLAHTNRLQGLFHLMQKRLSNNQKEIFALSISEFRKK